MMSSEPSTKAHRANVFRSAEKEYPNPIATTVTGKVPEWLKGSLLRNGPGKYEFGKDKYNHMFDGSALLHRFNIQGGRITYQCRFLQSETYLQNKAANRVIMSEFGTVGHPDPCKNIFKRFFSYFTPPEPTDNCCVNWFQIGEDFFVCTETNLLRKVDPDTLQTKEKVDLTNYMAINSATAHPHQVGGTTYNIGNRYGSRTLYSIVKIDTPDSKGIDPMQTAEIIATIPSHHRGAPSYYHSFAITKNYIIFLEQPLCINILKILTSKIRQVPIVQSMDYYPDEMARFHVIERDTGRLVETKYTSDAFFCFHNINAYEDNGHIVMDLCGYNNTRVLEEAYLARLRDTSVEAAFGESEVRRFVLPLIASESSLSNGDNLVTLDYTSATANMTKHGNVQVTWERLFNDVPGFELPQVNYKEYNGKKYRYAYGLVEGSFDLAKLDFEQKSHKLYHEENYMASEPVFVPAPNPKCEDDGVVLACMLSLRQDYNPYLVILDGQTFEEIARAEVPAYIPFGLHGIFVKGAKS